MRDRVAEFQNGIQEKRSDKLGNLVPETQESVLSFRLAKPKNDPRLEPMLKSGLGRNLKLQTRNLPAEQLHYHCPPFTVPP